MKSKGKQLGILVFLAVIAVLLVVSSRTPGTLADPENYQCSTYATIFSLLPPVVAIGLALVTKEVYTSLLVGILAGGLLYSNFNLELMLNTIFYPERGRNDLRNWQIPGNMGILVFLVMLGILVVTVKQGRRFCRIWKMGHPNISKPGVGAQISVMILGILIFVDDYFNCLTVGSVMRPVTDRHQSIQSKTFLYH